MAANVSDGAVAAGVVAVDCCADYRVYVVAAVVATDTAWLLLT